MLDTRFLVGVAAGVAVHIAWQRYKASKAR